MSWQLRSPLHNSGWCRVAIVRRVDQESRMFHRMVVASTVFAAVFATLLPSVVAAGDDYSLVLKIVSADAIVHVRLTFDRPIPERWPNREYRPLGWAFPMALAERACRTAKKVEVLSGPQNVKLPTFCGPTLNEPWWWDAHQAGSAEILLFLREFPSPSGWSVLQGVEGPEDPNPAVLALVRRAARWRRLPRDARIAAMRSALGDQNRDVVATAVGLLCLDAPESVGIWVSEASRHWHPNKDELESYCRSMHEFDRPAKTPAYPPGGGRAKSHPAP
jgi:hypothetical protein